MHLLDANVLIAAVVQDHVHHTAAAGWVADHPAFATTPITQGALVRVMLQTGSSAADAQSTIRTITAIPSHELWPDSLAFDEVDLHAVIGHRQVTDAYLAALARAHGARLATFDRGLAVLHDDVADLIQN